MSYDDQEISIARSNAFLRHMWYLSEELVELAFFDDRISNEEKTGMVKESQVINDCAERAGKLIHDFDQPCPHSTGRTATIPATSG